MPNEPIEALSRVKSLLQALPGVGPRSAERMAFHLLRESREYAANLADAIIGLKDRLKHCSACFNLTEIDPCTICSDTGRDHAEVWVVEQPKDLLALEATGLVRGVYHVLLGHIAPLEGIEPENLTINALVDRVGKPSVREIILALNPTMDGDATALYIQEKLAGLPVKVTRPARGLAVGSSLEFATAGMLEAAIRGRTAL